MPTNKDAYLGNDGLKKAGVQIQYTPEQVQEYMKCSKDIIYFTKTYMRIVSIDKGVIPFDLYPYQEKIITSCIANRYTICKLPRQAGKTSTLTAIMLWHVLFNQNYLAAILANKADTAREILHRIQFSYGFLPHWLQQGIVEWNKGSIELENGSKIMAGATSSSAIRGKSINLIYLDEFAFVDNSIQEQFFASVWPTISSGKTSKLVITSTPNGLDLFYKIWSDATAIDENGKPAPRNDYNPIDIHWKETPGRDDKWKEETIRATSKRQFQQEFETEFLGSTSTLIDGATLRRLVPLTPIVQNENLNLYKNEEEGHIYMIPVDVSEGLDGDYSAFMVVDVTLSPYEIVAVYKNNSIPVVMLPTILHQIAQKYNDAFIFPETNNGLGKQVADILHEDLEYDNIVMTMNNGRKGKSIASGFGGGPSEFGMKTTKVTKAQGCSNLKSLVENNQLIISDIGIIYELSRFVQKGKSYQAEEGCHDDLAMCCVLFAWTVTQSFIKDITNKDFRRRLLEHNNQTIQSELTPMGMYQNFADENQGVLEVTQEGGKSFEQLLWGDD